MIYMFKYPIFGSHSVLGSYSVGRFGLMLLLVSLMTSLLTLRYFPFIRTYVLFPCTEKAGILSLFSVPIEEDISGNFAIGGSSGQGGSAGTSEPSLPMEKDNGTPSGVTAPAGNQPSACNPLLPENNLHIPYLKNSLTQEEQQMLREVFKSVGKGIIDDSLDTNLVNELCENLSAIHRLTGPKIIDCFKDEDGQDLYTILKALSYPGLFPGKQITMPYTALGFICSLASCYMSPEDYNGFTGIIFNIYEHEWGFKENFTIALGMGKDRAKDNRGDAFEGGFAPNEKIKETSPAGRKPLDETFAKGMEALCELSGWDSEELMNEFEADRYRETLPTPATDEKLKTSHGAVEESESEKSEPKAASEDPEEICPTVEELEERLRKVAPMVPELKSFFDGCPSIYRGIIDAKACLNILQERLEDAARELEAVKAIEQTMAKESSQSESLTNLEGNDSVEAKVSEQTQDISVSLDEVSQPEYSRHCLHNIVSLIENLAHQLMAVVDNIKKACEKAPENGMDYFQLHKEVRACHLSKNVKEMMEWKSMMNIYKSISPKESQMEFEGNRKTRRTNRKMMKYINRFKNAARRPSAGSKPFDLASTVANTLQRLEALIRILEKYKEGKETPELNAVLDCLKSTQRYLTEKASPNQWPDKDKDKEEWYNLGLLFKRYGCVYQDWLNILSGQHTLSAKVKKLCSLVSERKYQEMQTSTACRYESHSAAKESGSKEADNDEKLAASVTGSDEGSDLQPASASIAAEAKETTKEKYSQVQELILALKKRLSDGKDERGSKLTEKGATKLNNAMEYLDYILAKLEVLGSSALQGEDNMNAIYALMEVAERIFPKLEKWQSVCQEQGNTAYGTAMKLADAILRKRVRQQIEKAFRAFEKMSELGKEKSTVWKNGRPDHYEEAGIEESVDPLECEGYAPVRETIEIIRKLRSNGKNPMDLRTWLEYLMTMEGVKVYSDPSHDYKYCSITGRQLQNGIRYYTGLEFSALSLANFMYDKMGYSRVQNCKVEQVGTPHPQGVAQRENIKKRLEEVDRETTLILSIDTKAKIVLGRFKHDSVRVMALRGHMPSMKDHDYVEKMYQVYVNGTSLVDKSRMNENAVLYPVGALCLNDNSAYVALILGKDTAESMGNLIQTVINEKKRTMPKLKNVLILADGGGANSSNGILWLDELLRVSEVTSVDIEVRHYAPGTSKFNAVERFWSKVSISWRGKPLLDIEHVAKYIRQAKDDVNNLQVRCWFDSKKYYTKSTKREMGMPLLDRKGLEDKAQGRIVHLYDDKTDFYKWNYKVYASVESAAAATETTA